MRRQLDGDLDDEISPFISRCAKKRTVPRALTPAKPATPHAANSAILRKRKTGAAKCGHFLLRKTCCATCALVSACSPKILASRPSRYSRWLSASALNQRFADPPLPDFPQGIDQAPVLSDGLHPPCPSATFRKTSPPSRGARPAVIRELLGNFSNSFVRKKFSTDISKSTLKIFS